MTISRGLLQLCASALALLLFTSGCMAKPSAEQSAPSEIKVERRDSQRCEELCSGGDWCPLSCPQSQFSLWRTMMKKRGPLPYDEGLGSLSFDDYLFLKMLDRA